MPSYKTVELFGGSIAVRLPSTFADVSNIRQVPDHQEVYLDSHGYTSIVVEILEHVDQPDQDALKYHLEDIVESDAGQTRIISTAQAHFANLAPGTPAYTLVAVAPPGEKQRERGDGPDFVVIYLTMLRLSEQQTDILIAIYVPFMKGQYDETLINQNAEQFGAVGDIARSFRAEILQTFEIKDWKLFDGAS